MPAVDEATLAVGRCVQSARDFYGDYQNVLFVGLLLWVLPMLAGMFWGAPLVAREIEHGTHRLAWTQGVSRLRWAATKIGLVSVAVLVMTAIYAGMLNWWITPVMQTSGQRFAYIFFDIHGIVVFGYALFALALGVFAGAVTGRMLPAMATTLVGFLGTRLLVMLAARPRYMPTETRVLADLGSTSRRQMRNDLNGDWIIAAGAGVDAPGRAAGSPHRGVRGAHHPPGRRLLGLPGDRNRHLRRARRRPGPRHHLLDPPPDRLTTTRDDRFLSPQEKAVRYGYRRPDATTHPSPSHGGPPPPPQTDGPPTSRSAVNAPYAYTHGEGSGSRQLGER